MRVGHAATVLPVPPGTPLGGYADRNGPSTGTRDELEVAAVSIASGGDRLLWIVADLPCVNEDLAADIRGAVGGDVWVSATHTHSGPETGCVPGGGPTPEPWRTAVREAAALTAAAARAGETGAPVRLFHTRLSHVGGQRSGVRPLRTVPVDVLEFGDAGIVVVLPIHPTVLNADNRLVSADLAGSVRRALAGVRPWVVVATGAAGDVSTRPHRRAQTPAECDRLGALTAAAVVRALSGRPVATVDPETPLRVSHERVSLPAKKTAVPDLATLEDALEGARITGTGPVAIRTAETALQAARLAITEPAPVDPHCVVGTATLGPVTLVALGAEPYLGLATSLPPGSVLIGYTNGYLGYLPTRNAYRRDDYEVIRSPVAAGSAELVLSTVDYLEETL